MTDWWKSAVIYQIYPRSFQDSDGDGVGDLAGIERRLDYLVWLGIDTIWISPFYPSPMADFGYDVSDYTDVDPLFGTLADFDRLIGAAHARDLRVIVDYVPNHTSNRHPWFEASRSSRQNPKRDWYIWRDPAPGGGGPPNNWVSEFGGSAWEWDAATQQYYYHAFLKEQPDLNWRNPEVRAAMHDVLRFWLRRGVDGFRMDVAWQLIKDAEFRDNPPNPGFAPRMGELQSLLPVYTADRPEVHEVLAELRRVIEEFGPGRVMIGEIYLPIERLVTYYGGARPEAHLPFNFHLIAAPWNASAIAELIARYERALPAGAWPNWVLGNHDRPRLATRIGEQQARAAAMLLLTLRGTPTLYYGDEIALPNVPIPAGRARDPVEARDPGKGLGRDPVRTPMQWDSNRNAGFTHGEPWLPLSADWRARNAQTMRADPGSLLSLYRDLLALRRERAALSLGTIAEIRAEGELLIYERSHAGETLLVALNLGARTDTFEPPRGARLLLATDPGTCAGTLPAGGGAIFELSRGTRST